MFRKSAFTLTELMIVIAIIAVLAGLLMPALEGARRETNMVSCINNLKQISNELDRYQSDSYTQYPPWLSASNLYETPDLLVCPQDSSGGNEGSRPDWIMKASQFAETNDMDSKDFSDIDRIDPDGKHEGELAWYFSEFNDVLDKPNERKAKSMLRSLRDNSNNKIKGASYLYEFNAECVTWGMASGADGDKVGDGDYEHKLPKGATWYEAKMHQKKFCTTTLNNPQMATRVPVVRCFFHVQVNNGGEMKDEMQPNPNVPALRITGSVNRSWPEHWESEVLVEKE
ncbi:MAG: type II secretion system protein [Planctomycetes bacterium]|nr:type II secretion system protein [Planctomycetota bacterium]